MCSENNQLGWASRAVTEHIYLDGAHNLPALERLVEFIQEKIQQGYQPQILFGALKRKDYSGMLAYLTEHLPDVALYVTSLTIRVPWKSKTLEIIQALLLSRFYR